MPFAAPPPPDPVTVDPSTGRGAPHRGGFLGFLTTLPGVLTAAAGLLTAVTGGIGLYLSQNDQPRGPDATGDTYNITVDGDPVPTAAAEVDAFSLGTGLPEASADDAASDLWAGCADGDFGACESLLFLLAEECSLGYGRSCDDLYYISEVDSAYEAYGATCGGRYDWTYAGSCAEL